MIYHLFKIIAILIFCSSVHSQSKIKNDETSLYNVTKILELEISSSINPATYDYLSHNYNKNKDAELIFIKMNTPGGLLSTTKEIISLIASHSVPTIIWIGPSGSSATSAGAIIASSASVLTMANGTNIGAATPISTTGDIDKKSDMRSKAINDISSLVKAQSQSHGRSHEPFEKMISEAKSFSAEDAFERKAIDFISNSEKEVFQKIQDRVVNHNGRIFKIKIDRNYKVTRATMDLGQKLLNILSSPNLAYILFLIGAALIYLEFQAPGGMVAGALGSVFLMLAAISFQVLPLNFGALGLIILSFVLLVLEIYITSFGILSIGAVVSLITGSMFLFRTDDSYMSVSMSVIFATVGAISIFLLIVGYIFMKSRKEIGKTKFNDQTNDYGVITDVIESNLYMIKTHGEFWRAKGPNDLNLGDKVKIVCKNEDMTYSIHKFNDKDSI